jgi:hypothetical protein
LPVPSEITSWDQAVQWARTVGTCVLREGDGRIYTKRWSYQSPEVPSPLAAVLQLYAHDVPELPFPERTDLFQLLWCPMVHDAPWCPYAEDHPFFSDLPDALHERVRQWQQQHDMLYWAELSTAPGTKVGGWPRWIQEPEWPVCGCGRRMHHLLTVASDEFEERGRWLPVEDRDDPSISAPRSMAARDAWAHHGIMLGGVGSLYLFTCTVCAERPLAGMMQCS